jgi:hypothetical protein
MSTISKNAVNNGLVGSTVTINSGTSHPGYGAIPPTPLTTSALNTLQQIYTTNTTGQFLTSGSNGTSWNGTSWTNTTSIADSVMVAKNNPPELEVKGRMVINGVDLEERLATIEKVLSIPERDVKLEKKHPNLKRLYDEYITALGKYRTFEAIKGE